jgi:hypothetical protein
MGAQIGALGGLRPQTLGSDSEMLPAIHKGKCTSSTPGPRGQTEEVLIYGR